MQSAKNFDMKSLETLDKINKIEDVWKARAKTLGYEGQAYNDAEVEFFCGAMATLGCQEDWVMTLTSQRNIL